MAKLSSQLILDMTEKIIYEKGMTKTTLNDIAKNLNVSHAALYKHFTNKEELFQKLAWRWLDETSQDLFNWQATSASKKGALHDWLWQLAQTKKSLFETDQRMFRLYTDYIEQNDDLVKVHLSNLADKAAEISHLPGKGEAIITAFVYFHNPYFAQRWERPDHKSLFEETWALLNCFENQIEEIK